MPELPEVEAARRAVEEHCIGKKIVKSIIADDSKVIDGVSPEDFQASLLGKTIVAAHRKGKNMWLQLDSPPFPTFQFGMAGAIYIKGVAITKYKRAAVNDNDEWPSKYFKFFVELDDGLELSFTDKRRFAKVRLLDNPVSVPPISELGPDALLEPMTVNEFYNSLMKKNTGIKGLLLDQGFISGIGNWMADEVLYQGRIHPLQVASSMSKESCETLLKCINEVIEKAVEVGADSSQFPSNWIFQNREKKPGKASIDGKKIEFINAGGRTTAYVPELQKLIGNQGARTVGRTPKNTRNNNENAVDDLDKAGSEGGKTKTKTIRIEKTSTKRKSKRSNNDSDENDDDDDDDNDDDDDEENLNETKESKNPRDRNKPMKSSNNDDGGMMKKTRGRKTPAKRKSKESESDADDDDDEDQDVISVKLTKTKTVKTSKKKVESSLKGKEVKKKAK